MSFTAIYLLSIVIMIFLYWIDRKNRKYRDMTYADFVLVAIYIFVPFVNTTAIIVSIAYFIFTAEFWNRRPYDDFH